MSLAQTARRRDDRSTTKANVTAPGRISHQKKKSDGGAMLQSCALIRSRPSRMPFDVHGTTLYAGAGISRRRWDLLSKASAVAQPHVLLPDETAPRHLCTRVAWRDKGRCWSEQARPTSG